MRAITSNPASSRRRTSSAYDALTIGDGSSGELLGEVGNGVPHHWNLIPLPIPPQAAWAAGVVRDA